MYKHRQFSWLILLLLLFGFGVYSYAVSVEPFPYSTLFGFFFVFIAALFSSLTVEADDTLRVKFGIGVIRRSIPYQDLASFSVVRNKWWWGYGIRYWGGGWMWNIWGLDAIELCFRNGKRFRIGTDDAQGLANALRVKNVKQV